MIDLVYLDRDIAVIYKPEGIPSQADPSGDGDAMLLTSSLLEGRGEPSDLWLIHRLDRTVGGLLVFARNRASAAELSRIVSAGEITKGYLAVSDGVVPEGKLSDLILHDKRAGKAFIVERERKGVKRAELISEPLTAVDTENGSLTLTKITLLTGRFHQIRAQLSHHGAPLIGDGKYGSRDKSRRTPALFAYLLEFRYKNKNHRFVRLPDLRDYPWCRFDESIIKELK